jgi:undecaprenyl-diphosphatase
VLEAIFLGALQGLTEFLPISSSAHIRFAGEIFGTNQDPGATFTAITQIGTELAVLIYFRKDILRIIKAWLNQISRKHLESSEKSDARIGWLIIVGSLPIAVLGELSETMRDHDKTFLQLMK